jgi:hypothetical protein
MEREEFNKLVNRRLAECKRVLTLKAFDYADDEDRLHNFKAGAALNRQTPIQFAWELATKHIIAIADKIANRELMTPEFIKEKMGDVINYMLLIEALNEEEINK